MKRNTLRIILLIVTLLTIIAVLYGSVNYGIKFNGDPTHFGFYWVGCFIAVFLIIVLAILDMRMIRKEHQKHQRDLDAELAKIVSDAEQMAAENGDQSKV